jgi:hypothetical protein
MNIVIAVCGASGKQGFSVIKKLNENFTYKIIYLTRDVNNDSHLKKISTLPYPNNIEIQYCDFDRPLTVLNALEGVNWVFINTNYWEHQNFLREVQQLKNIIIGCKSHKSIENIVFSTYENSYDYKIQLEELENVDPELRDTVKVPFFDSKGSMVDYIEDIGLTNKTCFLHTSFYYDNFYGTFPFESRILDNEKQYILNIPFDNSLLPLMCIDDLGKVVEYIFNNFNKYKSETIGFASTILNGDQITNILNENTNIKYIYEPMNYEEYKQTINPELANMFEFKNQINNHYCYIRNTKHWIDAGLELTTFDDWIKNNKNLMV